MGHSQRSIWARPEYQTQAISPLLANIALHGLEAHLRAAFPTKFRGIHPWKPLVLRYADDFIVLHEDLATIRRTHQLASEWLGGMELELKPSKTRITHTLNAHDGPVGFDFLGFHVRQYRVGKTHAGRTQHGKSLGFKTIIKPSAEAQKRHLAEIAEVVRRHRQAPQGALVGNLNPVMQGWANYYSTQVSKVVFRRMDHLTYLKLKRWAERRHPKKSGTWVARHYWKQSGERRWVFGPKEGSVLAQHASTPIRRHPKLRTAASFFDGDWAYWASRLGHHPELPKRVATLLKWQKGKCARCGLFFTADDLLEVDHIIPTVQGGKDGYINWQLVHRHCHDAKTAEDGSSYRQPTEVPMTRAKRNTVEEPDEAKASCPACAVRRVVTSPAQPGNTRRRCLGYQLT